MPDLAQLANLFGLGDPEASGAVASSQAMQPVVGPYLSGMASDLPRSTYDPSRSFAQNALDPQALQNAMNMALGFSGGGLGIKAYHGSPYDFNAFDTSKIGTGEGAQAYGHGLYFAENPETAQDYAARLARTQVGNAVSTPQSAVPTGAAETAAAYVRDATRDGAFLPNNPAAGWDAAIKRARDFSRDPAVVDLLEQWKQQNAPVSTLKHMYEVQINAEPHQFLDWDKPLSEQPEPIQSALQNAWLAHPGAHANQTGGAIYDRTARQAAFNIGRADFNYPGASEMLSQAGIPGIRYLDQGSRGAGQGTSNYVVFNPSLIDIIRKFGLAGLMAGGGAAAGASQ